MNNWEEINFWGRFLLDVVNFIYSVGHWRTQGHALPPPQSEIKKKIL